MDVGIRRAFTWLNAKVKLCEGRETTVEYHTWWFHAAIDSEGRAKVNVLSDAIKRSATARPFSVNASEYSVVEEAGFRAALDCDLLFSCVVRHNFQALDPEVSPLEPYCVRPFRIRNESTLPLSRH